MMVNFLFPLCLICPLVNKKLLQDQREVSTSPLQRATRFSGEVREKRDESNDAKIHLTQILPEQSGSVLPNAISVDAPNSFLGHLSYEYLEPGNKDPSTNTARPSLRPSYQPSHVPSFDKPSSLPSIAAPTNGPNLTDENIPSQHPSAIHRPTGLQSLAPSSKIHRSHTMMKQALHRPKVV